MLSQSLAVLVPVLAFAQNADAISATRHAAVYQDLPDQPLQPGQPFEVRNLSWISDNPKLSQVVRVPLIHFDLSDLSNGANIKSAKLRLRIFDPEHANLARSAVRICPIMEEWDAASVTWDTRPKWDEEFSDCGCDPEDVQPDQEYEEFDVTPLVRKWLDGSLENHGLVILAEPEMGFWSQIMYRPTNITLEFEYQ